MPTGGELVCDALRDAGIDVLVGLPGTQTLPLDRVVATRPEMRYVMARHETAVPHVAWGYYEASGRPAATLTVPGPGDTNAMHGLKNALNDNVPLIHVAADVNPEDRGKGPIHEIEPDTVDNAVKANVTVESTLELREAVERGVETALTPPLGPVRLGIPSRVLADPVESPPADVTPETVSYDTGPAVERAVAALADAQRPVLYVGGGARRAEGGPAAVRELADALDAPVAVSYKGKGVVPDDDPRVVGVTASHLNSGARRVLDAADVVLAVGTDFDGVTTDSWSLPMGDTLIHVTLDPDDVDAGYEADVPILGDAAEAAAAIAERLPADAGGWAGPRIGAAVEEEYLAHLDGEGLLDDRAPAPTPATLRAIRGAVPDEAVVTTDIGGHRLWALQLFDALGPRRYVTAGSWAGMGVGLPAAVGARLARPERPVVSLHGDGGLMMCVHELHTAAEEGLDLVCVVFADDDYGIISKSPEISDHGGGRQFAWSAPDFVGVAEGFNANGVAVDTPSAAADAVREALDAGGPCVVCVETDPDQQSVVEAADYDSAVDLGN
ncbi:MAG: thiamine pyrophosphate-binding protein [Halobacteriaceae archaeon]